MKKKIICILGFVAFSFQLSAQNLRLGAEFGINFASISAYQNPTSSIYRSRNYSNVRIGSVAALEWKKFEIQSGLFLDGKGGNSTYINDQTNTNRSKNTSLYYLEIPVNLLYVKQIKAGTILLGGGPYAAYGIAGDYTLSGIIFDSPVDGTQKVVFGKDENADYKRTDYGLNLHAEFRLRYGIGFKVNYEYGLKDIATPGIYDDAGIKTRNKVLGIAVSYLFRKKK